MTITAEQATKELRRRAAIKELQRRNLPSLTTSTSRTVTPTGIVSEPISPEQSQQYEQGDTELARNKWLRREIQAGRVRPEPTTFGQRFKQELPQMGGGMAGGIAGAKLGSKFGPYGALAGGVGGAFLGGMGGKGYEQTYRMGKGEPMTLGQIYKEQGKAGIEEGASEGVGMGTGKVIGKIAAPLKSKLIPHAPRLGAKLTSAGKRLPAEDIAELTPYAKRLLKKKGVFLSAAQATESRGMDFIESATESTIFGGNRIFQLKKVLQPKAYKQVVKEMSDTFWNQAEKKLSPEEVGQLFVDTVTGKRSIQQRLERVAYGQVDELMEGSKVLSDFTKTSKGVWRRQQGVVDLRPVKKKALQILAAADKSKGMGSSSGIKRIANGITKWDDFADSFMSAHSMRSNILEEVRKLEGVLGAKLPKVNRAAETLAGMTDNAMEAAARSQSQNTYTAWRAANKLVKEGREKFNTEVIQSALKLAKKRPELVAKSLFVPHGAERLAQVKKVITPETYKSLLASYMDTAIQKSTTADGILLGKNFKKAITQLGPEMHIQMFDSMDHLKNVIDVANLGEIIQASTGGGGGMVAQLTQAGAIIDLAIGLPTGQAPKKGTGLILAGPALMGRMLSTPGGSKWFSEGIKGPVGSKHVPAQVVRMLKAAYKAQYTQQDRRKGIESEIGRSIL